MNTCLLGKVYVVTFGASEASPWHSGPGPGARLGLRELSG